MIALKVPQYAELPEKQYGPKSKMLWPAIVEIMMALARNLPLKSNIPTINNPGQIMAGDQDSLATLEESPTAYRSLPSANPAVLPHTEHPMNKVRPDLLLNLIRFPKPFLIIFAVFPHSSGRLHRLIPG